jgi:hypothetical protein
MNYPVWAVIEMAIAGYGDFIQGMQQKYDIDFCTSMYSGLYNPKLCDLDNYLA